MEKKLNLLILEDNPDDAELMVKELESEGFTLKWSRVDTEEAFREALEKKPDLILADYKLPAFDGMFAIKMQQKFAPEIPLIIVSGTIGEELAVECMKAGAVDYISKDRLFRLRTTVKRALEEVEAYRKRRQTEEALRKSEKKYRTLTETATDIIFTLNKEGKFTYINPVIDRIIGHTFKELIGAPFTEILAPEYIESVINRFKKGLAGEIIPIYEIEIVHKDGKKIPIELNVTSLLDADGKTIGRIGIARDITKRKRAEEQLKEYAENLERMVKERTKALDRALYDTEQAREKVDGILKAITDGLIVTDRYDRVVLMNSAVEDLLEVRLTEAIGRPIDFAIRDETLKSHLKTALEKKKAGYRFDVQLPGKDKEHPKIIRTTTSIIKDKEGRCVNMVIIMHDVT